MNGRGIEVKRVEGSETVQIRFNNFADLSTERDNRVESPEFTCFGHKWTIDIFPGGDEFSSDGMVSLWLCNMTDKRVDIDYSICARDSDHKEIALQYNENIDFLGVRDGAGHCRFFSDFSTRAKLMRTLNHGALVIEAKMKLIKTTYPPKQFIIDNPICKNMLKMFMDEESSDVVFEVDVENKKAKKGSRKKAKTEAVLFHAHRLILQNGAPMLYELSKSSGGEIPINDVKPDIFRDMLHYVYGGKIKESVLEENSKEIIDASDKYGVVHLKLEAEAYYVKTTEISVDNAMDNLLYADSKNCALLKEAVMDFFVKNGTEAVKKVQFQNFPGYLVKDLLAAMSNRDMKREEGASDDEDDYSTMRVVSLRKELHKKGLDIDGSREAMIARLTEYSANNWTSGLL